MRVKIMLQLLWLLGYGVADTIVSSERGSRSSSSTAAKAAPASSRSHGQQASARERDFRPSSPWPDPTSVYKSLDIGDEHLIGGRVTFFTPDGFIRKSGNATQREKWTEEARDLKEKTTKTRNRKSGDQVSRYKRSEADWIVGDLDRDENFLKMHAFIVRDEDVPECGEVADKVTKARYFMCSGIILNEKHVLTSASCMNRAEIYKHHIDAELSVLIGALEENSYVIKIAHYEIHPKYVPDPSSIHHATNNVAILTLSCSIPFKSVITPMLPSNPFDNVAHMCCPDRCKLATVIETINNQHTIKTLQVKYVPSPRHGDHDERKNVFVTRSKEKNHKNRKSSLRLRTNKRINTKKRELENTTPTNLNQNKEENLGTKNISKNVSDKHSSEAKIDWLLIRNEIIENNVQKDNKEKLTNFLKDSMSEIITKTLESMTRYVARVDNTFSDFKDILESSMPLTGNQLNQRISDFMGKKILKLTLKELSIIPDYDTKIGKEGSKVTDVERTTQKDITAMTTNKHKVKTNILQRDTTDSKTAIKIEPEENIDLNENVKQEPILDNVYCPPLGSPIIFNNMLVALIAYTCDDAQSWVEWKYVDVVDSIKWIRSEMTKEYND